MIPTQLARVLSLAALSSIAVLAGCHSHHHDDDDRRDVVIYDQDHRFEHRGYYDARHDWHGGYYDEAHAYHADPRDFHGPDHDDHH